MAEIVGFAEAFGGAFAEVAPVLDERARRLLLGRRDGPRRHEQRHADAGLRSPRTRLHTTMTTWRPCAVSSRASSERRLLRRRDRSRPGEAPVASAVRIELTFEDDMSGHAVASEAAQRFQSRPPTCQSPVYPHDPPGNGHQ